MGENYGSPKIDSAAVELDDLIFRRPNLPPEDVSAGCDGNYGSLKIDSAVVDYGTGAVGLDDLIFRHTNLPPNEFSARRNGDYIWRDLWTGPSVCNRSVIGHSLSDHLTDLDDAVYGWQPSLFVRWGVWKFR